MTQVNLPPNSTVPTMWQCSFCGVVLPAGMYHECVRPSTEAIPPQPVRLGWIADIARVADALERIAAALEKPREDESFGAKLMADSIRRHQAKLADDD